MSWECSSRRCSYPPRNIYTSALYKVLLALKILTGTGQCLENPGGVKLEDIAMFYLKYYCVDGDVKSQVCASLRYGVKKNFIKKKKDKFSLITPAAAIHLAPCKCKSEQLKRIECIFPSNYTNERDNSSPCDPCCEPVNICRRPKSTCKINKKCSKPCRPSKKRKKRPKMMPWCEANEQQYSPCPPKKRKANPCPQEEDPCMDESSCFRPNDTLGFDIQRERCRNTPPSVSESEDDDEDQQQMCCKPCKPQKSPPCCCNNNSKEDTESSSSIECFPKNRNCFK